MKVSEISFSVVTERRDPFIELGLLASSLEEELKNQETELVVDLVDNDLVIAYHHIVVLHWRVVDLELVCSPTCWRRITFTVASAERAREITIRLVFEFVRELQVGA